MQMMSAIVTDTMALVVLVMRGLVALLIAVLVVQLMTGLAVTAIQAQVGLVILDQVALRMKAPVARVIMGSGLALTHLA